MLATQPIRRPWSPGAGTLAHHRPMLNCLYGRPPALDPEPRPELPCWLPGPSAGRGHLSLCKNSPVRDGTTVAALPVLGGLIIATSAAPPDEP